MLFVRCRRRKKNGECSFLLFFYHETERKNAFPLSFPRRRKKKQYAFLPLFWRTDKKKKKGERHLSFFILSLPQTEWRISLLPEKRKKEKDEKMEERRQKEEGQKRKGNGKKEKGERSERTRDGKRMGETATEHVAERRIPDAGEQKRSRKRILPGRRKRGQRTLFFAS